MIGSGLPGIPFELEMRELQRVPSTRDLLTLHRTGSLSHISEVNQEEISTLPGTTSAEDNAPTPGIVHRRSSLQVYLETEAKKVEQERARKKNICELGIPLNAPHLLEDDLKHGQICLWRALPGIKEKWVPWAFHLSTDVAQSIAGVIQHSLEHPGQLNLLQNDYADSSYVHASMIWRPGNAPPQCIEATVREYKVGLNDIGPGILEIYEHKNEELARTAAEIAGRLQGAPYNLVAAGLTVFNDSKFGPDAKKRYENEYKPQAMDEKPAWAHKKGTFCVEALIGAYQGAHGLLIDTDENVRQYPTGAIGCDPLHTSPSKLRSHYRKDPDWKLVGYYINKPEDTPSLPGSPGSQ